MTAVADRLRMRIEVDSESGCWNWKGAINSAGYGRMWLDQRTQYVHRVAHQLFIGPIPDGLQIDHLCRNRRCVNPEHLEAVTSGENTRRGVGPAARHGTKTHCIHGHPFDEANTYWRPDGTGRMCRTCSRESDQRLARRKAQLRQCRRCGARQWNRGPELLCAVCEDERLSDHAQDSEVDE